MIPVNSAAVRAQVMGAVKWRVKARVGEVDLAIHKGALIVAPFLIVKECIEIKSNHISVDLRRLPLGFSRLVDLLASMALHEAGHAVACQMVGAPVYEIGILPIGAYVAFEPIDLDITQKEIVFVAGPLASLVVGLIAAALLGRDRNSAESDRLVNIAQLNLNATIYNLLPLVITDGGQMLDEVLKRFDLDRRFRVMLGIWAGTLASFGLAKLNNKERLETALLSRCKYPPVTG